MIIKNRIISVIFKFLLFVMCLWGLYLNSGMPHGKFVPQMFCYYTIIDNTLALLFSGYAICKILFAIRKTGVNGSVPFSRYKGALIMMLTYLLISYHFFLRPQTLAASPSYQVMTLENILVHYVTPIMVILDWLLFDEKQRFRWYDPLIWLAVPAAYFTFILIRAELGDILHGVGSRYPYYTFDVDILGIAAVTKNILTAVVWHGICGYIIFFLDRFSIKNRIPN